MILKLQNDYGTLQCSFNELQVWFCDNSSNELFESLQVRMRSLYGESFNLHHVIIDTEKLDVMIYQIDSVVPFLSVSYAYFFRRNPDCDLLKFVNIFSRKKLVFASGRASFVPNRNFLRLSLHSK